MDAQQVIRNAIPDADDILCQHILLGCTSYPFSSMTAKVIYKAASRYIRATRKQVQLCEFCDKIATKNDLCESCRNALQNHHQ